MCYFFESVIIWRDAFEFAWYIVLKISKSHVRSVPDDFLDFQSEYWRSKMIFKPRYTLFSRLSLWENFYIAASIVCCIILWEFLPFNGIKLRSTKTKKNFTGFNTEVNPQLVLTAHVLLLWIWRRSIHIRLAHWRWNCYLVHTNILWQE